MGELGHATPPETVVVHAKRRNVEAVMIVLAQTLCLAGWLIVHLNMHNRLPPNWIPVAIVWYALGVATHLVVRFRLPWADPVILPITFLLNGLGLMLIARIAETKTTLRLANPGSQAMWTMISLALFVVVVLVLRDIGRLKGFPYLLAGAGLVLLALPLVPGLGRQHNGAWLWVGIGSLEGQPAEFAKIVLAFAFAAYVVEKKDVLALAGRTVLGVDLPRGRDLAPILIVWAAAMMVLVFQGDIGTGALVFGLFVVMLYVATGRPGWPILALALTVAGGVAAYMLTRRVAVRLQGWLDPFGHRGDETYQMIQGQFGLAWGGLSGTGLGRGRPTLTPLAHSDMIPATVGEELGAVGLIAVVVCYCFLVARGLKAALISKDEFTKLVAVGLSFGLGVQTFLIIGGVTRLLPLTGLTTPFMSQGGSAMVSNWLVVAGLLIISNQARTPRRTDAPPDGLIDLGDDVTRVVTR